jgi:hydrogenase/urease accessory protein HupE
MLAGILALLSATALAHDPGLSAAEVRIFEDRIVAEISFAPQDVAGIQSPGPNLLVIADEQGELELRSASRKPSDQNSVHFLLEFSRWDAATSGFRGPIRISAPALASLPRGHKQFCSVYDERNRLLAERMLDGASNNVTVELHTAPAGDVDQSVFRFLVLGIEHILTGYDHLAFLLALLLGGGPLRRNAKIITSFTLAHSLTLALATFDLINIGAAIVEPIIAASIVFVGIENLVHRQFASRWLVTFVFGLVHGLGFASALRELGIGGLGARAAIPLLSFNVGVELAQITIAALVLPLVWRLQQRPTFVMKHAPVLSLLLTIAGIYWFLARTIF